MSDLQKILVIVDGRMRKTAALERGVALARKSGAQLFLCMFDHDPLIEKTARLVSHDVMVLARSQYLGVRQQWLAEQAAAWADHGVRVECEVIWAPVPHEAILAKVLELMPSVLVKDVQSEPLRQRLIHTPLDWRILRFSPVPVMMVRQATKYFPRRIAAAIDTPVDAAIDDPLNDAILDVTQMIGRYCESELHATHVAMPATSLTRVGASMSNAYQAMCKQESETFKRICDDHQVPPECRHLLQGDAATELARFAQRMDIDLMVLGSSYRTTVDRFFLGSTTESLLGQVECDVLLVKNPDFAQELGRHVDLASIRERQSMAIL